MTHNDLRYEFGPYQLNPSKRILTRDGEGIPLTPKATEILLVLVKDAGQLVETIARHGYRFTPSVNTIGIDESEDFAESDGHAAKRPLVVVLPFDNSSGDIKLDYLADGLTHNVINNLSRLSQLRVMSHSAAFRYKTGNMTPDGEAALAESLRTAGVVAARQWRYAEAKRSFEAAFRVAERCGDHEGAGLACC